MNRIYRTNAIVLFFILSVLVSLSACTSAPQGGDNPRLTTEKRPQLTEEKIRETINEARVRNVPEQANAAKPISWNFDFDEPKDFKSIETQMDGDKATVVVDLVTRSAENARNPQELSGKIKLHYELHRGLILRQWQVVETENISMTYRRLADPKPATNDRPEN